MTVRSRLESLYSEFENLLGPLWRDRLTLVAVTKTVGPEAVREAAACGVTDFGENRVQELTRKVEALGDLGARWHMIGHLQTNKAALALRHSTLIHSVDSLRLAVEIDRRAQQTGKRVRVLVEVNVSGEPSKSGLAAGEVERLLDDLAVRDRAQPLSIVIEGFMTMAPYTDDETVIRPVFTGLRNLLKRLKTRPERFLELRHLSMGMTNDYRIAIEEGATIVRLGTRIFGENQEAA
jgi:pyridoxal phosphate enzyme (YggS family)